MEPTLNIRRTVFCEVDTVSRARSDLRVHLPAVDDMVASIASLEHKEKVRLWHESLRVPKSDHITSKLKVVSLGSSCAVNSALINMGLRQEAYPFDNIRTSLDGVVNFLATRFSDFLPCQPKEKARAAMSTISYHGKYHSFWHHNLDSPDDHEKYRRRIGRFLSLGARSQDLLFVYACNSSLEVAEGDRVFESLKDMFGQGKVWLLLVVDGQSVGSVGEIDGTKGRLFVHSVEWRSCADQGGLFMQGIQKAVSSIIDHILTPSRFCSSLSVFPSCDKLAFGFIPFTGGDPRNQKYKLRRMQVEVRKSAASRTPERSSNANRFSRSSSPSKQKAFRIASVAKQRSPLGSIQCPECGFLITKSSACLAISASANAADRIE